MFLNSILAIANVRVRLTPSLVEEICKLAGTDKFSKALPNLEIAIKTVSGILDDINRGCKVYVVDAEGNKGKISFDVQCALGDDEEDENATMRNRITKGLANDIITLAERMGFKRKDGKATTISNALPYLHAAIIIAEDLKERLDNGTKFYLVEPNGEKYIMRFFQ